MRKQTCLFALPMCLLLGIPTGLYAQQEEIPPAAPAASQTGEGERIVEGRPRLYPIKRGGHPVSWLKAGIRPILRLAGKVAPGGGPEKERKPPRVSGVKFGAEGFGAGSGFGPEVTFFHRDLLGTGIELEVPFAMTFKRYESAGFLLGVPVKRGASGHRLGFELSGQYLSRASDAFFGLGNDSSLSDLARYRAISRRAGAAINARLGGTWLTRVGADYRSVGVTAPRTSTSALDAFADQGIPGLATGAVFIDTKASLERDTRDHPDLPDFGGLQRVEVSLNEGIRGGDFSYWHYRADLQQLVPLGERKVFDLRAAVETNRPKGGSSVPLFDLPVLGTHSTLRGFQTRRFTDRSALMASAEYRYRIWRYFDMGLFADAGQVAPEIGNFAFDNMHVGYGARIIARTSGSKERRFFSFDAARSRESWRFYVSFGGVF